MTIDEVPQDASRAARLARHASVEAALAVMSDRRLGELVGAAPSLGSGIGGTRALLHVAGTPVFVKRVPLTDLERRPENVRSTANLFDLPMGCQYGVGGAPSFGVWRELAANEMATGWVLDGRTESFPLMYHWRVLEGLAPEPLPEELADVERAVALLHGSAAVRHRIEAIAGASATVTFFLEYLPQGLTEWLAGEVADGSAAAADAAIAMVERRLRTDVALMNVGGLFHFDAHFGNILTDGQRLYFGDFGLAMSPRFRLSATESGFLAANLSHDPCHTITRLVDWLVTELTDPADWQARNESIRRIAEGDRADGVMPSAAAIVERYAPIAVVVNEFYRKLHLVDRDTPYPTAAVARACAASGVEIGGAIE